jgi:hypothetical protein
MNRDGKGSGGGLLLLLGVVLLAFVAQYVATKPASPAASQAVTRFVTQNRRQSAIGSQETKEGYVIDPALARRMLADTAIRVRVTGVRGFSANVIARATVTAPAEDGAERSSVHYFALQRANDDWNATGEVKARDWYLKVW